MIELNVFDLNFNRIGELSEYKELTVERNYTKVSSLILRVAASAENISLLQQENILTTKDNVNYGYYIENFEYTDEANAEILITAYSLNYWLYWRVIMKQQRYYGNVEDVVKAFINSNCISTTANRVIPNLRLASNSGVIGTIDSVQTGKSVGEHCFEICNANEMTIDVLMNHADKKYDVVTWKGVDRSALQSVNPHVLFSKQFDNIINQQYTNVRTDYKTTAVVAGEGEGVARTVVTSNGSVSGLNRREIYIDARNVQSTYRNENDVDVTLTPSQYQALLIQRGVESLSEYQVVETFESAVDMYSQFTYGVDYSLGDVVSILNDEIKRILHTRVISAILKSDRNGIDLSINFGSNIPTLFQKIKKKVR